MSPPDGRERRLPDRRHPDARNTPPRWECEGRPSLFLFHPEAFPMKHLTAFAVIVPAAFALLAAAGAPAWAQADDADEPNNTPADAAQVGPVGFVRPALIL